MHACPDSAWRSPLADATDDELISTYSPLEQPVAVYGHIHQPFVREPAGLTVVNSGSVGQPLDGDPRAAYVLIDAGVEYNVEREIRAINAAELPYADWVIRTLGTARPQLP